MRGSVRKCERMTFEGISEKRKNRTNSNQCLFRRSMRRASNKKFEISRTTLAAIHSIDAVLSIMTTNDSNIRIQSSRDSNCQIEARRQLELIYLAHNLDLLAFLHPCYLTRERYHDVIGISTCPWHRHHHVLTVKA